MAIDKNIFNTLNTGARNQIISAYNQGNTAEAERLYSQFTTPTQTNTQGAPAPITTQKVQTPNTTQTPTSSAPETKVNALGQEYKITGGPRKNPNAGKTVDPAIRQQQMLDQVNKDYASSSDVKQAIDTGDFTKFKSKYSAVNPAEEKVLEGFYQAHQPKTTDSFFNILSSGQKIQNTQYQTSKEAADAQHRWDLVSPYKGASADNIYSAMVNNQIVPGSEGYNDLVKANGGIETPEMLEAKQKYQQKVNSNIINSTIDALSGKKSETNTTQTTSDNLVNKNGMDWALQFQKDVVNNPELTKLSQDVSAKDKEIADLEAKSKKILKDIAEAHPGINTGLLYEIAREQQDPINEQLTLMYNERNKLASDLKYKSGLAAKMFNYKVDQNKIQEQRAYEEDLAKRQLEQKVKYIYGDLQSKDPTLQKIAAVNMAQQIQTQYAGMPFRRDVNTMANDIVNEINSGKTPDQITTEITNAIQKSPAYNQWAISKGLKAKPTERKFEVIGKDPITGNDIKGFVDTTTGEVTPYTGITTTSGIQTGAELYKQMTAYTNPIGVYATGDMSGDRHAQIYKEAEQEGLDAFIKKYKGTKITSDMVNESAQKYGVDPLMIAATMALDSSMGTKGKGVKNNNPGNIGQFDSLDAKGITVKGYKTLQEGIDAVANNLAERQNALGIGGGEKTFTETQKNLMSKIDVKNPTKTDETILRKSGLTLEDVYNYQASLKAGKWSEGLDDTEYKRVNSLIDDVATNQVTKTFQKSQEAYLGAINFAKGDTATDDQALIYAFAKAMDPDSVVREGEYATVQKYSQTWGQKFGMDINRVLNGQEFISPEAKNNIVQSIKSKYEASKSSYLNLRKNKLKQIDDIAGKNIGDKALPSDVMDIGSIKMYPDGTFIEYDTLGNYRYYGKDKKLSEWKKIGTKTTPKTTTKSNTVNYGGKTYILKP